MTCNIMRGYLIFDSDNYIDNRVVGDKEILRDFRRDEYELAD